MSNESTITFEIHGNQETKSGNPIPYVRSTQGGQFKTHVKRYREWQDYVRAAFLDQVENDEGVGNYQSIMAGYGKPIKPSAIGRTKFKSRMDIDIRWANGQHGDPDNVWKGIADALFTDDKYLDGSFTSKIAADHRGKVIVKITFYL